MSRIDQSFSTFEGEMKKAEISMTPLIDMVFILLIFFVVTTTFEKDTGIEINRPEAEVVSESDAKLCKVAIDSSGTYWFDTQEIELDELIPLLKSTLEGNPKLSLLIIPDKLATVESLIRIMDRLRVEGISQYAIASDRIKG